MPRCKQKYLTFASISVFTHVSTRKYESPSEVLPQNLDTYLRNVTYINPLLLKLGTPIGVTAQQIKVKGKLSAHTP
jgi:hypothetical protein